MIIECTKCHAKYQYDEGRFERRPTKKIRCAKCQEIFEIQNPAFASKPATDKADMTVSGRKTFGGDVRADEVTAPAAAKAPEPVQNEPSRSGEKQSSAAKLPTGKRLSLAVIDGPDAGQVFRMEKPRVVIGRSSADLILNDAESSRAHAAVEAREMTVILEDLGSTNGTLIDGAKITGQVEILNQSEFQVGSSILMLIITDGE